MAAEARLRRALAEAPPPAGFWWRDDDAGRDHPRLERLLALAERRAAPVALAVVPGWLEPGCAARVRRCPRAWVLQHGVEHRDRARPGERRIELGGAADLGELAQALAHGRERLRGAFGARFLPVLVPPWNRIAPPLLPLLPALGYAACSALAGGGGPAVAPVPGLRRVDAHLDLVAWRDGRRPLTFAEAADRLAAVLRARPGEPIGVLSHHLVMDDAAFAALDRLLALLQDAAGPGLLGARTLLGEA